MSLSRGDRVGSYEAPAALGLASLGEVYRTRLRRFARGSNSRTCPAVQGSC